MGRKVAMRYQFADYLNVGTTETKEWALMGTGFKTLDEEPGAQTDKVKYVNEKTSTSSIVGYETVFPFEADHILEEKAIDKLWHIGRDHLVGPDAELEYCRVELFKKEGETGNAFTARMFTVAAEISSFAGENKMGISGNLNAVGDPVFGSFDTTSREFTAKT